MRKIKLMRICKGGLEIKVPEIWSVSTEEYTEPDGRVCTMIEVSATEGDPRSIIISYGPMPEGSDALMEAGGKYEELIGEFGPEPDDDPICDYDFLGRTAYGFECPTEDNLACNFICADIGTQVELETGTGCKLLAVLTTAATYEQIDELLDLIEENISFN